MFILFTTMSDSYNSYRLLECKPAHLFSHTLKNPKFVSVLTMKTSLGWSPFQCESIIKALKQSCQPLFQKWGTFDQNGGQNIYPPLKFENSPDLGHFIFTLCFILVFEKKIMSWFQQNKIRLTIQTQNDQKECSNLLRNRQ